MAVPLSEIDIAIRLVLSFTAGAIIGLERSSRRQVAGLRTHTLICLGASCLMLLSIWMPQQMGGGDPGRIAAQVVAGMGFLGAGAIIKLGNSIRGLTTAASLWLTAAIGLTIGAGMYIAAGIVIALALVTLILLHFLEQKIFPEDNWKKENSMPRETTPAAGQVKAGEDSSQTLTTSLKGEVSRVQEN